MSWPGIFSPIEDVIREAEERAVKEWNREHRPCDHPVLDYVLSRRDPQCALCGVTVIED